MSVFTGNDFIYNNLISSKFNLKIAYLNNNIDEENPLSSSFDLSTETLPHRSKLYKLGYSTKNGFEFKFSFFREQSDPLTAFERNIISNWLTGDTNFKPLRIIQDDMSTYFYNCFFKDVEYISVDGNANGFVATAVCDAPFAWKNEQVYEKKIAPLGKIYPSENYFEIINQASDHNYTMPKCIEVDLADNTREFTILNTSNKMNCKFTGLLPNDQLVINDMFEIWCKNRENSILIDTFSGDFPHLINGVNKFKITGQIKRFKLVWQSGVKIG